MRIAQISKTIRYNLIMCGVFLLVIIVMSFLSPYFLSFSNLLDSTRLGAEIGIVALGMSLVILLGGIDLSVGSTVAFCSVLLGVLLKGNINPVVSIGFILLAGMVLGTFNGFTISRFGLPAFLVTLSTMGVYRGLAIGISKGESYPIPDIMRILIGENSIFGIPFQFLIFLFGVIVLILLFKITTLGRMLLVTGNNETSSKFSGINVSAIKILVYTLSGFFSSVTAVLFCSRVISAKADFGQGYELDAITIVVLGGATLKGGKINPLGTLLGMLIIIMTRRGLTMALIPSEFQTVFLGLILITAVALNSDFINGRRRIVKT